MTTFEHFWTVFPTSAFFPAFLAAFMNPPSTHVPADSLALVLFVFYILDVTLLFANMATLKIESAGKKASSIRYLFEVVWCSYFRFGLWVILAN
jgi:hypothetical protein